MKNGLKIFSELGPYFRIRFDMCETFVLALCHVPSKTFHIGLMGSTDHQRQGKEFGIFQSLQSFEKLFKNVG